MHKIIPYIYILFFIAFSKEIVAQQLTLKITSKDRIENSYLQNLKYQKEHLSEKTIHKQIDSISENLKLTGYFLNTVDSIVKKEAVYTSYFSLGPKIKTAFITLSSKEAKISNYKIKKNIAEIPIEDLSTFLTSISNRLDKQGKSFSEVTLKNIQLHKNNLIAGLDIKQSKRRTINRVIVKGYKEFSKSYIKHFLNIKKETVFNQQKLKEVSAAIQSLNFVSEIKPPEVLFSKDSTLLYIYIKKNKVNNFDGLVNFASKENGNGLLFNGHLDLKLNNILHTGEQFKLFWKANGEERQQFEIATQIPYIFNSAFTPTLSFNIYKQDSTFLNTTFHSGIAFNINPKTTIALTYDSENSENTLQNNTSSVIKNFDNSFLGAQFIYQISNNDTFNNDKFYLNINPSFGNRNSDNKKINQFKIAIEANYLWQINYRSAVFIRNQTGYLNSDEFIENELYRIGGANSIRGFNEQSIFSSQYSFLNLEYRYLTSQNSYLYSITDLGKVKTANSSSENLYGLGLGYLFRINNSQINLGYVLGKNSNQRFDFESSKLIISFLSYF